MEEGSTEADGDSNLGLREDQLPGAGFWGSDFLICSGGYVQIYGFKLK